MVPVSEKRRIGLGLRGSLIGPRDGLIRIEYPGVAWMAVTWIGLAYAVRMSERGETAGGQATVQNLPVDSDALDQQFLVARAQVHHPAPAKTHFENAHTTHDRQTAGLSQAPCGSFVNDGKVSAERTGEQHCGEFTRTQRMKRAQAEHLYCGTHWMALDPLRFADSLGGRSSNSEHDNFSTHVFRDVDSSEELPEQVKLACPRQGDERGGVGNDNHSFRRATVSRSSARSSAV